MTMREELEERAVREFSKYVSERGVRAACEIAFGQKGFKPKITSLQSVREVLIRNGVEGIPLKSIESTMILGDTNEI